MQKLSTIMVIGFASLALAMGCSQSATQKVADAKANEVAAKQDVKDAVANAQTVEQESAAREEWLTFKGKAEGAIAANDKIIADYKAKMTNADGKLRAQYDRSIDALETKNNEMKAKLDAYQDSGKSAWEKFKSEFGHDMDDLGTALKNFTVDSKK
jgi:hypothetical protein